MENKPKEIIIHHSGDQSRNPQFEKVNLWHKHREFPISSLGFYCGYHYFLERNGLVIKARNLTDEGAHTKGKNLESIGIGLAGNFDFENPTTEMTLMLAKLCAKIAETLKNPALPIRHHWEFSDTRCPGDWFRSNTWKFNKLKIQLSIIEKFLLWLRNFLKT